MDQPGTAAVSAPEAAIVERSGAGHDARKRRQILDGARRLFLSQGFDAASMGDIAREAGVSKGTLYVYFDSKERLFTELVREEKEQQSAAIFALDPTNHDIREVLGRVGRQFVRFLTSPHVIMAMRTVIAIGERMPELAADFYAQGPRFCSMKLSDYLASQVEAGFLAIGDTSLAATQFLDMAQTTLTRPLLFGVRGTPTDEQIATVVASAVEVFLAAYLVKPAPTA